MLVGGTLAELLPALLAHLGVQAGERFTRWLGLPETLRDLIAGMSAVAFAMLMHRLLGVRVGPVVAGGIMILVPGILFTSAVRDAIAGDLLSATARGLEAFLKAAALAVGVAGALYLFGGGQLL